MTDTTTKRTRVSNEQLLQAISDQTAAITQLVGAISTQQVAKATEQVQPAPVVEAAPKVETIKVDAAYRKHMDTKAQDHANSMKAAVVEYARRNKAGEVKLGYALKDRFVASIAKQSSCLGALAEFNPS